MSQLPHAVPTTRRTNLEWIDAIKGASILWIVLYHTALVLYAVPGYYHPFDHPKNTWPDIATRVAALAPIAIPGVLGMLSNGLRYLSWLGYQGVHLFLVMSGLGLALAQAHRGGPVSVGTFYRRRLFRIFPEYWAAHVIFLITFLIFGTPWMVPASYLTLLSLLGVRSLPETFSYIATAWWYIGLIIQLYLAFPLLWAWLDRFGARSFLIGTAIITAISRLITLIFIGTHIEFWSMGVLFTNRLFEFGFGMALGMALVKDPDWLAGFVRRRWPLAALIYLVGLVLSLTLLGSVIAPMLIAVGLFGLMYMVVTRIPQFIQRSLVWVGSVSYGVYLLHHPVVIATANRLTPASPLLIPVILVMVITILIASFFFQRGIDRALARIKQLFAQLAAGPSSIAQKKL
jgi:peptidoglycan/LPS O-acetylase OafA/YrhL